MSLPENFSPTEFLQDAVRLILNKEVRQWFNDVEMDEVDPDLGNDRARLRFACTHQELDTVDMTILRLRLFDTVCGWANSNLGLFYGMPIDLYQEKFQYKPQIQLHFVEDWQDLDPGYPPVTGRISFRLMNETSESISRAQVEGLATRTKTAMSSGDGFVWRKGKGTAVYYDNERGYRLRINVRSKAEGKQIVEQVLDIQSHSPDWKYFKYLESEEPMQAYPTIPPTKHILGETVRMPRQKPIADVRFAYALLHVHGRTKAIVLVDRVHHFRDPVIAA